ncbi:hypothetical protein C8Q80DRAFT_1267551 [Daedaleopsis nitida]|nr:hypothetical protein C8Q80DRAFT_1267551 [Daedaleopsis nitida]
MSDNKNITLYASVASPFPHRVCLALEEAGIIYDTIWIDLIVNKQEWYEKAVYPAAKVPYLVYGGKKLQPEDSPSPDAVGIPESLVILEFLADAFPDAALLPADPVLRAKARLFYQAVETKLLPAYFGFLFLGAPVDAFLGALDGIQQLLPPDGGFAVGQWSIADAAFMPLLVRLDVMLKLAPFTIASVAQQAAEALQTPRFARIQKYKADNMARASMAKTWDEDAATVAAKQRMERFRLTGKINSDLTLPVPKQD